MKPLSPAVLAALSAEAGDILTRIAKEPALLKQYEERLSHLADRLGESAMNAIVEKVKAQAKPAAKPEETTQSSPTAAS
jgi:hypothetical protein